MQGIAHKSWEYIINLGTSVYWTDECLVDVLQDQGAVTLFY